MERRAALAIGLSLLVLYLYQAFVLRPQTRPPTEQPKAAAPAKPSDAAPAASGQSPVEAPPQNAAAAAVTTEAAERSIVIDNGKVVATISNRGGTLLSWRLKEYLDEKRQPLDLIPSNLPDTQPRALTLKLNDPALMQRANSALYRITGDGDSGGTVSAAKAPATITLEYEDADGLRVKKVLRF
jgi:YidC/Oxa1 family membrane protein insertase